MSDLISRQDAIDAIDKHLRTTDVPVSYPGIISALTEWLNELPSAEPEQLSLQKFTEYQIEWLTSHCDIELEQVLEGWIVRFLRDTAECYEAERRQDE